MATGATRVGFIGLGAMGKPMCRNLLKAGFPLTVWNRSRPAIDELVAAGAAAGSSSADVGRRSQIVDQQAHPHATVRGAHQMVQKNKPGGIVAPDVVLHVEAPFGPSREHQPRHEGVGAPHERVHT
jgi:3-hydroxyisobutyrate dehydrogenase-like beta-hydroxyacid dehydrogenase